MRFTLEIDCDTAAFDENGGPFEIAAILHKVARKVAAYGFVTEVGAFAPLFDSNGNTVGRCAMTADKAVR